MLPIKATFSKYGHRFQLLHRIGDVALYERTLEGRNICYELIIILPGKEKVMPSGRVRPAQEEYPNSDKFGSLGWSLIKHTKEKAMQRFLDLVAKRQKQAEQRQNSQSFTNNKAA